MAVILQKNPILTLDISSTSTGVALQFRNRLLTGTLAVKGDYGRLLQMGDLFLDFIRSAEEAVPLNRAWEVWVETPFYSVKRSNDAPIKMAHGILMYVLHLIMPGKFLWNYVHVSTWRKALDLPKGLKGPQLKEEVKKVTSKRFNIDVKTDDIGDALGILMWRQQEAGND